MSRTPKDKLKRYSDCIRQWTRSGASYAILDEHIDGSWESGGCAALAMALHRLMPGSTLWAVVSSLRPERPQHVLVKWQGLFWDARGARKQRSVERFWRNELWPHQPVRLVPLQKTHSHAIRQWRTCSPTLINEIVDALQT